MRGRSYSERDVALLVRCPSCRANPENPCLNKWATEREPTHLERFEAARQAIHRVAALDPEPREV